MHKAMNNLGLIIVCIFLAPAVSLSLASPFIVIGVMAAKVAGAL